MSKLQEILERKKETDYERDYALRNSNYWPYMSRFEFKPGECMLSTLVRIEREGKWYFVHVCQWYYSGKTLDAANQLTKEVSKIQHLFVVPKDEKYAGLYVDRSQMSEKERIWALTTDPVKFQKLVKPNLTDMP